MAGIQIRYVGGPKDGQYEDWAMQGGRPPAVIEAVIEEWPQSLAEQWTPDLVPPVREEVSYTRCSYYRLGKRDIRDAELYVTDTVRRGLALGLSFSILGVASVELRSAATNRAHFVGGCAHGRIMTIGSPPPEVLRMPVPREPSFAALFSGDTVDVAVEMYDLLRMRDAEGNWIYLLHDYMRYVVNGRVPAIAGVVPSIIFAIQIVAARYANLVGTIQWDANDSPCVQRFDPRRSRSQPRPARRRDHLPDDEAWTTPAGGRGDPLAGLAPAKPWTKWKLIKDIDEVIGDGGDDAGSKQTSH